MNEYINKNQVNFDPGIIKQANFKLSYLCQILQINRTLESDHVTEAQRDQYHK